MKIQKVSLLNFGSLATNIEEKEIKEESLTGYFLYPTSVKFLERTETFIGRVGLKFGIEYFIEGYDKISTIEDVIFECKIIHPTLINPKTKKASIETIEKKNHYLNQSNFDYYFFEFEWEIKKGIWAFQIIQDDNIFLEKNFIIK